MKPSRKSALRTPLKIDPLSANLLSVGGFADADYKLVATPVRRSMRPKSMHFMAQVQEQSQQVAYVDNLDQLSPKTKAKVELRANAALKLE